jgi:hypothetical protein
MKRLLLAVAVLATIGMTTNAQATIGWAGNVWPLYGASVVPTGPVTVYAQVWKGGVTDSPGQGAGITAELRYTTDIAPMVAVAMTYNSDIGNNDEYKGDVPQAALVGAAWVDVTVIFTDTTDNTTFEVTGDQQGHVPPLRYFVTNVTPVPIDVTFTLCMSGTATNGAPCVIGSAAEIGTWGTGVTMNSLGGELWQVTVTFAAGSNPAFEYKYKKDGCVDWECCGNRAVTLPTDGTTSVALAADSYNYAPIGCGLGEVLTEDKVVCLQVCLSGVQYTAPVCAIGSVAQLTNWGAGVPMALVGPDLYQACITFPAGTAIPVNVEYKFKKDNCETWESVGNRTFTIDNTDPAAQTLTSAWDDGPSECAPVGVAPATWGTMKGLYR